MNENHSEHVKKRSKRKFARTFTWLGLLWGVASFFYLFMFLRAAYAEALNWTQWALLITVFFPACLTVLLQRLAYTLPGGSNPLSSLVGFALIFTPIVFGTIFGRLVGKSLDVCYRNNVDEDKVEAARQRARKKYTRLFTYLGPAWGIASFIYLNAFAGNYEMPLTWGLGLCL